MCNTTDRIHQRLMTARAEREAMSVAGTSSGWDPNYGSAIRRGHTPRLLGFGDFGEPIYDLAYEGGQLVVGATLSAYHPVAGSAFRHGRLIGYGPDGSLVDFAPSLRGAMFVGQDMSDEPMVAPYLGGDPWGLP